jgi:5-methylcytosine-specific restriction endonuclease McrA
MPKGIFKHIGRRHTEATKIKMRNRMKGNKYLLGYKHTEETKKKMHGKRNSYVRHKIHLLTEKSRTEINKRVRCSDIYKQWRQAIFIRDNFTCQDCRQVGGYFEAHHKKALSILIKEAKKYLPLLDLYEACLMYIPLWDLNNGITLCKKCHNKTKKGRGKI